MILPDAAEANAWTVIQRRGAVAPLLLALSSVLAGSPITFAQPTAQPPSAPTADARQKLAADMDAYLWKHVLAPRFPRCVDEEHGGFHVNYARDWTPLEDRSRFVVYQARVAWTAATVARLRPEVRNEYLPYVRHGVRYLADVMWDREAGGFHTHVDLAGRAVPADSRPVYGLAFAIYGLAAAHAATGEGLPLEGFGGEEYTIRSRDGRLLLAGGRPRGTLYAVYRFLQDQLGVRWYTPWFTHIPKRQSLTLAAINVR